MDLIRNKTIEPDDLSAATHFVLDTVACIVAGRRSDPGQMLRRWSQDAGVARGVFLASGLAHTLEVDDLHKASVTHPGCVVVPAAWHLAQERGASGRDLLVAVLHGYEAMTRVGMAAGPAHYQVWHSTSTCGPFGAAMSAAALLSLDREHTIWALGSAGTQASGLWQFLPDGAMSKHLHAGHAAEAGVVAASLAAHGFTGAARILEGEQGFFRALCPDAAPEALVADPDAGWQLLATSIKPWPCCRHTHPAIDAALELHEQMGADRLVSAEVHTYQAALDVCDRPAPQTEYAAKFSLQHCVHAALVDGAVDFASFGPDARTRLAASAADISTKATPEFDQAYPERWGAAVSVRLASGQTLSVTREDSKGDPELPLSTQEITQKARMLMSHGGLDQEADSLIDTILALSRAPQMPDFSLAATAPSIR